MSVEMRKKLLNEKIKELQSKTYRPFKYNKYTVFDLEEKFKLGLTHQYEDKGE